MASRAFALAFAALQPVAARVAELTEKNFGEYIRTHDRVMVDFVREDSQYMKELADVDLLLRMEKRDVSIARVNIDREPALAKKYFEDCDEEKQVCAVQFPQVAWFLNGQATQYHRHLVDSGNMTSFALAMDRDFVATVAQEADLDMWNRYLLFRGERSSAAYRSLEHVAARHMDTLAVAHIEEPGSSRILWIANSSDRSSVEVFDGSSDEGELEAWIRHHMLFGEEAPADAVETDGSVAVVASTFEELVLRSDSDVFLLVYAPWCGFSRKVMPEWSKLASELRAAGTKGLVVAKMNGALNVVDTQEFKWKTFPTIVYFRSGDKTPLYYEGDRTVASFMEYAKRTSRSDESTDGIVLLQKSQLRRKGFLSRALSDDIIL